MLEGLRTNLQGTTVVLVSQRIAAVRRADLILCLENGRVSGLGTHDELARFCGAYRAILASQLGPDALPPTNPDSGGSPDQEAYHHGR